MQSSPNSGVVATGQQKQTLKLDRFFQHILKPVTPRSDTKKLRFDGRKERGGGDLFSAKPSRSKPENIHTHGGGRLMIGSRDATPAILHGDALDRQKKDLQRKPAR